MDHAFNSKKIAIIGCVAVIVIIGIWQAITLHKAHSTFENYYAFRGCTELLEKTDAYGICRTGDGQVIKIVKFQDKWFLDGDLPWGCAGSVCFGW